ncbi:MAG: hydroxypyruvate isomerase family protein [Vicinamibacterales bacterium]
MFAANLTLLFTELPFLERIGAAASAGFEAVECQFPYDHPIEHITHALRGAGVGLVLHNMPAGDWAAGERGIACHPGRVGEFRSGVGRAVRYATGLRCPNVNVLAGLVPAGVSDGEARATFVENLRYAAGVTADAGLTLLIEPINGLDVPGFFLRRADEAVAIIREVGAPNLRLQLDLYHTAREGDDLVGTIERVGSCIGHVQIADVPGRHEPGTGRLDFAAAFAALDRAGYAGWVGCEYNPLGATVDGLGWRSAWMTQRRTE